MFHDVTGTSFLFCTGNVISYGQNYLEGCFTYHKMSENLPRSETFGIVNKVWPTPNALNVTPFTTNQTVVFWHTSRARIACPSPDSAQRSLSLTTNQIVVFWHTFAVTIHELGVCARWSTIERVKIQQAIGPHEGLLTVVKRRKLQWYGHVCRSLVTCGAPTTLAVQG